MEADITLSGTTATLNLGGSLTVPYATQLKGLLMQGLGQAETIVIQFRDLVDVDLSIIQLLCAAHRMSVKLNKRLLFGGDNMPEIFIKAVDRSGFRRHIGCSFDMQENCVWASLRKMQPAAGAA